MKTKGILISLLIAVVAVFFVQARSGGEGNKKAWRQGTHPDRSLFLDIDPSLAISTASKKQSGFTAEQSRELRSLEARHHDELIKGYGVAQDAREELERMMDREPLDESAVLKISERAILADAAVERARMQFWLEARQHMGKELLTKIRQTQGKHLHEISEDEASPNHGITPPQKPQLPLKD